MSIITRLPFIKSDPHLITPRVKQESAQIPMLPFIRRYRVMTHLLKPPGTEMKVERDRLESMSPSLLLDRSRPPTPLPRKYICSKQITIRLKRLDESHLRKRKRTKLDLDYIMNTKVAIKIRRLDEDNKREKQKSEEKVLEPKKELRVSLLQMKMEQLNKHKSYSLKRKFDESELHTLSHSTGNRMSLELERIDKNILFHVKISNPEAVMHHHSKVNVNTPEVNFRRKEVLKIKKEIELQRILDNSQNGLLQSSGMSWQDFFDQNSVTIPIASDTVRVKRVQFQFQDQKVLPLKKSERIIRQNRPVGMRKKRKRLGVNTKGTLRRYRTRGVARFHGPLNNYAGNKRKRHQIKRLGKVSMTK